MLNVTTVFRGHAAWLIFRQAEPLYVLGRHQVAVLRHRDPAGAREVVVFNQQTETAVLFGPNVLIAAALDAGINERAVGTVETGAVSTPHNAPGVAD